MNARRMTYLALLMLGLLGGAGCAMFNDTRMTYSRHVTTGQELIDLKKALDAGAITPTEYEDLKAKIKKGVDAPESEGRTR